MDVAFIKHAKHDVDRDESGQDEDRFVAQRRLKSPSRALETGLDTRRQPDCLLGLFDCGHGISQRSAGREIEGHGDHRELSLMVDG